MPVVSMKALLESGVHFGHRTHKWHPAMKPYIFTERNSIHIIDLQKTSKALDQAYNLVREVVSESGTVLFIGTKRQAQETIQLEATRAEMPYVTNRWLGGMLTNWRTIRQRINELERLERMRDRGDFQRITKKETLILTRKMERLEMLLGGIRKMVRLPDLLFVVDVSREDTAIHEANLLDIPVIALVDTNCDPSKIDFVIPSNDDAIRAIKLLVGKIADAAIEGRALRKEEPEEAFAEERARAIAEEPELSDEELLGEATLAKIPSRSPIEDELEAELAAAATLDESELVEEEDTDISAPEATLEDEELPEVQAMEEPEDLVEADEDVGPEEMAEPEEMAGPEDIAEPEEVAGTEEIAEPEEMAGPEDIAEPEEMAEPEEVTEPEVMAEADEEAEAEEVEFEVQGEDEE
jgi:small subunit ribosomal protein S2